MITKTGTQYLYSRPYNADEVKQHYGQNIYERLIQDPAHKWRMETGIELIHKEPTLEEQLRIYKNWKLMSAVQKELSDTKSMELFNKTNLDNHKFILGTRTVSL